MRGEHAIDLPRRAKVGKLEEGGAFVEERESRATVDGRLRWSVALPLGPAVQRATGAHRERSRCTVGGRLCTRMASRCDSRWRGGCH